MTKWYRPQLTPTQYLLSGFFLIIWIGAILLNHPISSSDGNSIGILNALFTSTSAVCLTGLAVVDTGSTFSLIGQIFLLILVQIGGLGFMTFAALFAVLLKKKIGLRSRLLIQQSTQSISSQGMVRLVKRILFVAVCLEGLGTILLTAWWLPEYGLAKAFYHALFHSISAFNNAGFSLWSDSMMGHVGDPVVNLIIMSLFFIGGMGFLVILDIWHKRKWRPLTLQSKIILSGSLVLTILGVIVVTGLEYTNPKTLGSMDTSHKLWGGFFQGITPRSAGFNSIAIHDMKPSTQFFLIILMFIGAGSGSTGGGIKINTAAVLLVAVWSLIRGNEDVQLFKRRIGLPNIFQALAVVVIAASLVLLITFALSITEKPETDFLTILFEATSAVSTVGLSMGLTTELSPAGKVLLILAMYIGKLGTLTAAYALAKKQLSSRFRYPQEKVLIG
ncbi:TrkH family potassium uptake protein [Risungbinella massiliensis]|uniref:TrkH family potassium uptake protein n=1 Tax=Risungbinella massiliensis TaxID=1329796 RepID=UPI0005CC8630|nr:TrkH family potassium uptake protein [Risungbinella massiliensis]